MSLPVVLFFSSVIQNTPSSEEQTPHPSPPRGHCPFFSCIAVTFMPTILRFLANFLIIAQASSVLPTFAPAEPIISMLPS